MLDLKIPHPMNHQFISLCSLLGSDLCFQSHHQIHHPEHIYLPEHLPLVYFLWHFPCLMGQVQAYIMAEKSFLRQAL